MIINKARKIRSGNPQAFAWAGLRKYQNVDLVTDELIKLHSVPAKWHHDAKKQAQQIRYCLIQAREYLQAAQAVSLATKPNLLYYGIMSLALAEILFKQSGDSSLDRARGQHRHHGLTMSIGAGRDDNLAVAAARLRAAPMEVDGSRRGTFDLWHNSAREHPIAGDVVRVSPDGGSTTTFELIFGAADKRLDAIPSQGLSLWQCLISLPAMSDYLGGIGFVPLCVRGVAQSRLVLGDQWNSDLVIILHPSPIVDSVWERILVDPNCVDRVSAQEILGGRRVQVAQNWINGNVRMSLPQATAQNSGEIRFMCGLESLNEFGLFYTALFIAGNYARYFPDRWLLDVERSTPLAMALEELCAIAEMRVPMLALSELDRTLFVLEE